MSAQKRKRASTNGANGAQEVSESESEISELDAGSEWDAGPFVQAKAGEGYFLNHYKACKTSDARFSEHVEEPFTPASYLAALPVEVEHLSYDLRFGLWSAELDAGFSLAFLGRGSKRALLERFARSYLGKRGDVVSVNGYVPALSLVDVIEAIEKQVLKGEGPAPFGEGDRTEQRVRAICDHYSSEGIKRPLYLVVHNIEGAALRLAKTRSLLAMMAAAPSIHFICSFDHVRTPLLFPTHLVAPRPPIDEDDALVEMRTFNFVFHHVPTGVPYTYEPLIAGVPSTLFDPSVFAPLSGKGANRGSAAQRVAGCISVLSSLGKDQHDLFVYLSSTQRASRDEPTSISKLQDRFQLINPERFDGLLRELFDHEILEKQDEAYKVLLSKDEIERVLSHAVLAQAMERVTGEAD